MVGVTHIPPAIHRDQAERVKIQQMRGCRQVRAPHFPILHNQHQQRESDIFRRVWNVLHTPVPSPFLVVARSLWVRRTVAIHSHRPVFRKYHRLNGWGAGCLARAG